MIGIGPIDKWQHDLEKLSRHALIELALELTFFRNDRDALADMVARNKRFGRFRSGHERYVRFIADPEKAIATAIRRSKAAKKAAKRKKRSKV